jgi:hypothetical protein
MYAVLKAIFLFLLLVVDWAEDPYQGRSPFSQRLGSQVAICCSLTTRAEVLQGITPAELPFPGSSPQGPLLAPPSLELALAGHQRPVVPPPDLLYLLMSLQR